MCVCVCMRIYPFVLIFFSIVFAPKFGNVVVAGWIDSSKNSDSDCIY